MGRINFENACENVASWPTPPAILPNQTTATFGNYPPEVAVYAHFKLQVWCPGDYVVSFGNGEMQIPIFFLFPFHHHRCLRYRSTRLRYFSLRNKQARMQLIAYIINLLDCPESFVAFLTGVFLSVPCLYYLKTHDMLVSLARWHLIASLRKG